MGATLRNHIVKNLISAIISVLKFFYVVKIDKTVTNVLVSWNHNPPVFIHLPDRAIGRIPLNPSSPFPPIRV